MGNFCVWGPDHDHYGEARCDECDAVTQRMAKQVKQVKTIKDVLVGARELIQNTGWCQGQYALKDGKNHYNFISGGPADSYCLVGAVSLVAHDFWLQEAGHNAETQKFYNKLSYDAARWVVELQKFDGCPADWNDQDEEENRFKVFAAELRSKNIPRDQAKPMITQFRRELKAQNIPPILTKEKVLAAIDYAIAALDC